MGFFNGEPLESQGTFVSRLLIQLIIILVLPRILHYFVLQRIWQPRVVSEIISGIILGPSVLGLIPGFTDNIFPPSSLVYLNSLAQIGLILFLFMVGLGLDLSKIWETRKVTITSCILGLGLPLCIAPAVALAFLEPQYTNASFQELILLIALLLMITALAVLARILADRKLLLSSLGSVTMSTTAVDTFLGWVLLAIVLALYGSRVPWIPPTNTCPGVIVVSPNDSNSTMDPLYIILCYLGLVLVIVFPIRFIFGKVANRVASKGRMEVWVFWFSIVFCFAVSWVTQTLTLSGMFGAFTLGLLGFPRGPICNEIRRSLDGVVVTILLPVFFARSGLRTDWTLLDGQSIARAFLLLGALYCSKLIAVYFSAFVFGMRGFKGIYYALLLTVKGLTALAMLNICLDTGIITPKMFALCVLYSIIATIIPSPLIRFVQIFDHYCKRNRIITHDELDHILVIPRASYLAAPVMSIGAWLADSSSNATVTAGRIINDTDEEFLEFYKLENDSSLAYDPILGICNNRWLGTKNKTEVKLKAILAPDMINDMKLLISGSENDGGEVCQPTDYLILGCDGTHETNHLITSMVHIEKLKLIVYMGKPGSDLVTASKILLINTGVNPADDGEALNLALAALKDNPRATLCLWPRNLFDNNYDNNINNIDNNLINTNNGKNLFPENLKTEYPELEGDAEDVLRAIKNGSIARFDAVIIPMKIGMDITRILENFHSTETPIILVKAGAIDV